MLMRVYMRTCAYWYMVVLPVTGPVIYFSQQSTCN